MAFASGGGIAAQTNPYTAAIAADPYDVFGRLKTPTTTVHLGSGQTMTGPENLTTTGELPSNVPLGAAPSMTSLSRAAGAEDPATAAYRASQLRMHEMEAGAQSDADAMRLRDSLGRANQDRMLAALPGLFGAVTGGGGAATTGASEADTEAARTAAFARAKDRAANLARTSLMTLRASAAERGVNVAGGTNPALLSEESRTLAQASQPLTDLNRDQALTEADRANTVADRNFAGNLATRSQNMSLAPSLMSLLRVGGMY